MTISKTNGLVGLTIVNRALPCGYNIQTQGGEVLAFAQTYEEAETARLAFERVLLPRFTADEAIVIVKEQMRSYLDAEKYAAFITGMRATLEALAAAAAFVPDEAARCSECCGEGHEAGTFGRADCKACGGTGCAPQTMADKLDRAGIR